MLRKNSQGEDSKAQHASAPAEGVARSIAHLTQPTAELLTSNQVGHLLKIANRTVCQWADLGLVPGFKMGRQWRFRYDDIRKFVDHQRLKWL